MQILLYSSWGKKIKICLFPSPDRVKEKITDFIAPKIFFLNDELNDLIGDNEHNIDMLDGVVVTVSDKLTNCTTLKPDFEEWVK